MTVLDKDAFVSERLSHDELKQVLSCILLPLSCHTLGLQQQTSYSNAQCYQSVMSHAMLSMLRMKI